MKKIIIFILLCISTIVGYSQYTSALNPSSGNITSTGTILKTQIALWNSATQLSGNSAISYYNSTTQDSIGLGVGGLVKYNFAGDAGTYPYRFEILRDSNSYASDNFWGTWGNQNNTASPDFHTMRCNGSIARPTATLNNNFLFSWGFRGYGTTKYTGSALAFQAVATENWTDVANGSQFVWQTTPNGSSSSLRAQRMTLNGTGQLIIGTPTVTNASGTEMLAVINNQNGVTYATITNTVSNTAAVARLDILGGTNGMSIESFPAGFTGTGVRAPNASSIWCNNSAGLNLGNNNAGINFYMGGIASTNKYITFASTGIATFSSGIAGTTTTTAAAAGIIGESISATIAVGSAVTFTTATAMNVATITLTAGDWDVEGNVNYSETSSTVSSRTASIGTTSATLATDGSEVECGVQSTLVTEKNSITLPRKIIRVSSSTPVYLVAQCTFSAGTAVCYGTISARRVR